MKNPVATVKAEDAVARVRDAFPEPLRPYMALDNGKHELVAEVLIARATPSARLLDFGAGACDKTAVAAVLGFDCVAVDDFGDSWHAAARPLIEDFAEHFGITLAHEMGDVGGGFDVIMALDVIEHFSTSPRRVLERLCERLNAGGTLMITVPNAVSLRKRLAVLRGRTNYPRFDDFYLSNDDPYRGHIREYCRDDLSRLAEHLGLEVERLEGASLMLQRLPGRLRRPYLTAIRLIPDARDSWLLVLRRGVG